MGGGGDEMAGFNAIEQGLNTQQYSSNLNVRSTHQSLNNLDASGGDGNNFQFANNNI